MVIKQYLLFFVCFLQHYHHFPAPSSEVQAVCMYMGKDTYKAHGPCPPLTPAFCVQKLSLIKTRAHGWFQYSAWGLQNHLNARSANHHSALTGNMFFALDQSAPRIQQNCHFTFSTASTQSSFRIGIAGIQCLLNNEELRDFVWLFFKEKEKFTQNLCEGEKRDKKDGRLWGQAQCYRQHGGPSYRGCHQHTHLSASTHSLKHTSTHSLNPPMRCCICERKLSVKSAKVDSQRCFLPEPH